MSTNKHAQIRYIALDKCFSNIGRKYAINDLVDGCNQAIYDFTGRHDGVKKRQVYEDIKFMESSQGWHVELNKTKEGKRVYYRYSDKNYSINHSPLSQVELSQIQEVLFTLSRFRGMPQFEWVDDITERLKSLGKGRFSGADKIIDFEQNQFLKGLNFISPLFNAIYNQRVLKMVYVPFKSKNHLVHSFHPYYLKQYNLRWFVFGLTVPDMRITNLALDRIESISEKHDTFIPNTEIDFNEYFDDIIGVTIPQNVEAEAVVLFVTGTRWPYIDTKPLHGSQKPPKTMEGGVTIELQVKINNELIQKILSYGDDIKVIAPERLKIAVKNKVEAMLNSYK